MKQRGIINVKDKKTLFPLMMKNLLGAPVTLVLQGVFVTGSIYCINLVQGTHTHYLADKYISKQHCTTQLIFQLRNISATYVIVCVWDGGGDVYDGVGDGGREFVYPWLVNLYSKRRGKLVPTANLLCQGNG